MADADQRFSRLFRGRENCYGQYATEPKNPQTVRAPVPPDAWERHLAGEGPFLGIVPIRQDNACFFGAIDFDDDAAEHAVLAKRVAELQLPLTVCRSKSGGAHIYLFLAEPVPAREVQARLKTFATVLGISHNPNGGNVEIFPKQVRTKPDDVGNWINLPYYGGDASNRYAHDDEGNRLSLDGFLNRAELGRVSLQGLMGWKNPLAAAFEDGPPCLRTLHETGYPPGTRNQGLYNIGVYMKMAHPDDWAARLEAYNEDKMDPPLSRQEVTAVCKSLERLDYTYKCLELPIQPHCKKALCNKQPYGIKAFKKAAAAAMMPDVTNLVKVMTVPPLYKLTVNAEVLELEIDDLLNYQRFKKVVASGCNYIVPMLGMQEWDDFVRNLMDHLTIEAAPEDAGDEGQFRVHVRAWLLLRKKANSQDDLLAGMPFGEAKRVLFKSTDLEGFLVKRGFRAYSTNRIFTGIVRMGGGSERRTIRGEVAHLWWLPVPDGEQSEDLGVPAQAAQF